MAFALHPSTANPLTPRRSGGKWRSGMADKTREERRPGRSTTAMQGRSANPFQGMQRFVDEMDRMFSDFGLGRRWFNAPSWRETLSQMWTPNVDVFQKDDQLTI